MPKKRTMLPRHCAHCGSPFYAPVDNIKRGWGIYCGRACSAASRTVSPSEQLARHIDRSAGPDACWPWTGSLCAKGYGVFGNPQVKAHRVAWEVANGRPVPSGLLMRHLCHVRRCCNPSHLAIGTYQDNTDDSVKAGRHALGARQWKAKLTDDLVREARQRWANGDQLPGWHLEVGVARRTLMDAIYGETWKHVS